MDWHARIRAAFEGSEATPHDDVIEELAQHAGSVYDAERGRGCSEAEANARVEVLIRQWRSEAPALRHRVKRQPAPAPPPATPDSRLTGVLHDVRFALRLLRRQPQFAALAILTTALGIGATTALFSVTYGVLVKPLPWPTADRLIVLKETRGGRAPRFGSFTNATYLAWKERPQTIDEIAAWSMRSATLAGAGDPERLRIARVTASMFRALGAQPLRGALFTDQDETAPVVVISEGLWHRRFGADEDTIGRAIQLDGESRTIVGVLPDVEAYPDRQTSAWLPFHVPPPAGNLLSMFEAVARLRPGASIEQAMDEGTARGRFAADTGMTTMAVFGGDGPVGVRAAALTDSLTADVRRPLTVLLAAVALLLAVGTTNVAGLQLARANSRRRELAIRASIGASTARIVRQLVIESATIGVLGGIAGFALAWWLLGIAPSILPADFPRLVDVSVSLPVVLFAVAITGATSLVFGLWPALRLRRLDLVASLAEDGVSPSGGRGRTNIARTRLLIVTGQLTVTSVLLVGGLLLVRSFVSLLHADRGYDPAPTLTARLSLPSPAFTPARRSELLTRTVDRLRGVPGVADAAFSTELPLTPGGSTSAFTMPSRSAPSGTVTIQASPRIVSPHYFSALGLRILEGRPLEDTDTDTSEPVIVVNETFRRLYLGADAIGSRLPMGLWGQNEEGEATIVGVSEDVRYVGATTTSLAELYFSHRQLKAGIWPATAWLMLRASGDRAAARELIRSAVREADPALVADSIMTLEERLLATSLARPRLYATLVTGFAVLALVMTGVGLFGVLSYVVSQRTRELGVRAALGATRAELVGLIVRQGLWVAAAGLLTGLIAAAWTSRFLQTFLYGVAAADLTTYAVVAAVVLTVTLAASLGPARRAARLDPVKALRS